MQGKRDDAYIEAASKVVDGLNGDAFVTAQEQYISRRRRCWNLLMELDKEIVLSEGHRSDMPLDLAGLGKHEKIMIQASIGNSRDFQKVADTVALQHPRIRVREHRRHGVKGSGGADKGYHKKYMT